MSVTNTLVFDIETVPDVEFGRRLHGLDGLSDKQVGYVMQTRQREVDSEPDQLTRRMPPAVRGNIGSNIHGSVARSSSRFACKRQPKSSSGAAWRTMSVSHAGGGAFAREASQRASCSR